MTLFLAHLSFPQWKESIPSLLSFSSILSQDNILLGIDSGLMALQTGCKLFSQESLVILSSTFTGIHYKSSKERHLRNIIIERKRLIRLVPCPEASDIENLDCQSRIMKRGKSFAVPGEVINLQKLHFIPTSHCSRDFQRSWKSYLRNLEETFLNQTKTSVVITITVTKLDDHHIELP